MTILDQGVSEIEFTLEEGRAYFNTWDHVDEISDKLSNHLERIQPLSFTKNSWYIDEFLKYDDGKASLPLTNSLTMEIQVNDEGDEVTWKYVTN